MTFPSPSPTEFVNPAQQPWHDLDIETALKLLESDEEKGLSSQQVESRRQIFGLNELKETGGRSALEILWEQFTNIMLVMLIAVAIVSGFLDLRKGIFPKDAVAIFAIVILNGALGYLQESKAEEALAALKRLSSPKIRVVRDQQTQEIDAKELVPGDVMLLEAGVQVAADGRLIDAHNLQLREAALTGEAEAVTKNAHTTLPADASLGDRINLIFQGTEVIQGRGAALVTKTGMDTEIGHIAALIQSVETEPTPLQQRMTQLGNVLVSGSLTLVALVVAGGVLRMGWPYFEELLNVSLSMAVAVVPEGLPAVVTVTLAIGTQRMVRRHALIRKLPAVETLGSVTTICSDKTGTLTQNKMVVQKFQTPSHFYEVTGEGYAPSGEIKTQGAPVEHLEPEAQTLLEACVLCNDALLQPRQGQWEILGDPTEGALLTLAGKAQFYREDLTEKMPRLAEIPFSSERKRMSVIVADPSQAGAKILYAKGSPEILLETCSHWQSGAETRSLTPADRQGIVQTNNQWAAQGLRVLGFAYRRFVSEHLEPAEDELVWLGLVAMLDAPRPEVKVAVAQCKAAGIRPVMITGDHQLTAQAIAETLGISEPGQTILTGKDLEMLGQIELDSRVDQVSVYARVSPEHKLWIVHALQNRGQFVAMTGDGVNDAPALKQADIGIAMGITGTDVSKEASDMILLDDNFATIVAATEE
ncbi:MAG: HAD-IC family P-type ATPase, partial [Cyanobacteriota bacterium]|nr:HAD-IC family P-type ATPase [Cyanobacteriota bacterium]